MKKLLIIFVALALTSQTFAQKKQPTPQKLEQQMLSTYKYQYKFVNQYTEAVPLTITVKYEDGTEVEGQISDGTSSLIFPSNHCITYFEVEGNKPAVKFEAGHSYYQSESISTSHTEKICGSRTFTIVSIDDDPYIQVNWPAHVK